MAQLLFVIGAGASVEFGFPTGRELLDEIQGRLERPEQIPTIYQTFLKISAKRNISMVDLLNCARTVAQACPYANSIDDYIAQSKNEFIAICAKTAIVDTIIDFENSAKNMIENSILHEEKDKFHKSITRFLIARNNNRQRIFDNVVFLSFNYDRLFGYYIFNSLKKYFGADDFDSDFMNRSFKISHPYGQCMPYAWNGVEENFGLKKEEYSDEISYIRTYNELFDKNFAEEIKSNLEKSNKLVFLGFGYHKQNIELLRPKNTSPLKVYGTAKGISEPNIQHVKSDLGLITSVPERAIISEMTCDEFLDFYWRDLLS